MNVVTVVEKLEKLKNDQFFEKPSFSFFERNIERYDEFFGLRDFNFSDGWLHRFKQRYHLRLHTICGESGDISSKTIEIERKL